MPVEDIFFALRWWIVLLVLGLIATPITHRLLARLPDRGYAFSKIVGLLLVSYLFWILGSLGFLDNDIVGIVFSTLVLATLSVWSILAGRDQVPEQNSFFQWFRREWKYVLTVEIVFTLIFAIWSWVRAQNPAITATEKPMEFAFLNSIGRSPSFPPLDPWLSGFAISYYYFGYIMTSVVSRLAFVPEYIAFNLGIAWLVAATAVGAFGLVYNLIASAGRMVRRQAMIFGLVAAVALPIAGNMEVLLELLHANGLGSDSFWQWLDVRDLNGPAQVTESPRYESSQWWWWRSSRVIHEYHLSGRAEEGLEPIAEFPGFSFVLGDMHPHVLALPYAFLGLALGLGWWLRPKIPDLDIRQWRGRSGIKTQFRNLSTADIRDLGFSALVVGGLAFLNTWDVLIHLALVLGSIVLALRRINGRWSKSILSRTLTIGIILTGIAFILYLPFYLGFRSQAGPPFLLPMTMRPTRLVQFLIIFGMPLISIVIFVGALVYGSTRKSTLPFLRRPLLIAIAISGGIVLGLFLLMIILGWIIALSPDGTGRIVSLASEIEVSIPSLGADRAPLERFIWATTSTARLIPTFISERLGYPGLTLLLAILIASIVFVLIQLFGDANGEQSELESGSGPGVLPFVLLLIFTGALLTLGPEFVYLRDNFGQRLNTIFKFYYQAWVLFGVAALFGLNYLLRRHRIAGIAAALAYATALIVALLFPWYAIQSRAVEYRGPANSESRLSATLNGLAYMTRSGPDDYEAIMWLRDGIDGVPVVLEAVGGQYSAYARVSANTGMPTVLGWAGHEFQWRGNTPEPNERDPAVKAIYSQRDWRETAELLNQYDVSYIYFGPLEKSTYDPRVENKFDQNLEVAFRNGSVKIYRWQPSSPE